MPMFMKPLTPFGRPSPISKLSVAPFSLSLFKFELCKTYNRIWLKKISIPQSSVCSQNDRVWGASHIVCCHSKDVSQDLLDPQVSEKSPNEKFSDSEELELLSKPLPIPSSEDDVPEIIDRDEALEPFLKLFKSQELEKEQMHDGPVERETDTEKKTVEYYEPKPGDFVLGLVVSGNENKLDVNVGADLLGTMLTKDALPLYNKEMDYLLCDLDKNAEEFMVNGKMGIILNQDSVCGKPASGKPVVDVGNVLVAEVLGRTLCGRPLLSCRRYFRRIAWDRVRQIEQLGQPIQVRITEWNTGGLVTRIEGLRAFLPKGELVDKVNSFADLKDKVGNRLYVQINRINEDTNDLIISEREAWEKLNLRDGSLLEGTVKKIFPYGALVQLGQTDRSGLLHVSNISRTKFNAVSDLLQVGEKVKVLVIKSLLPDKISLSIAHLESEPGLFISDKEKVFKEAEEMARRYRRTRPSTATTRKSKPSFASTGSLDNEESVFANWKWFIFQRENDP